MFNPGCRYRHSLPNATLDIEVVRVIHKNLARIKLRVRYVHRSTGEYQYTGRGLDEHSDTVRILTDDIKNWTQI